MTSKFTIDSEAIRKLADILNDTHLSEIEYEDDGRRIRVSRNISTASVTIPQSHPPQALPSTIKENVEHPGTIKSPMVGTIYMAAEPSAPPFIKIGDHVTIGQTMMIIEAMKVMNPLKASKAGKITQIFVQNGTPVEFGEPLFIIE